jgi:hypothetical protein
LRIHFNICNNERMGKIEGGEERFKKPSVISPIPQLYIIYWYINFIIQLLNIDINQLILGF